VIFILFFVQDSHMLPNKQIRVGKPPVAYVKSFKVNQLLTQGAQVQRESQAEPGSGNWPGTAQ
jgi:hypothetical protein